MILHKWGHWHTNILSGWAFQVSTMVPMCSRFNRSQMIRTRGALMKPLTRSCRRTYHLLHNVTMMLLHASGTMLPANKCVFGFCYAVECRRNAGMWVCRGYLWHSTFGTGALCRLHCGQQTDSQCYPDVPNQHVERRRAYLGLWSDFTIQK